MLKTSPKILSVDSFCCSATEAAILGQSNIKYVKRTDFDRAEFVMIIQCLSIEGVFQDNKITLK